MQRSHPKIFGGRDGPLGRYYMADLVGQVADITWSSQDIDAAFDFYVDGNGSYARRRMTPSMEEIVTNDLPNVAFWPVVFPVSNARHRNGVLSMAYLALTLQTYRESDRSRSYSPLPCTSRHTEDPSPLQWCQRFARCDQLSSAIPL